MGTLWGAVCTGPGGDGARARPSHPERKPRKTKSESQAAQPAAQPRSVPVSV
jgi:hypothetical protein